MQMWTGRPAGGADSPEELALPNGLAQGNCNAREVRVPRLPSTGMVQDDQKSVAAGPGRDGYATIEGGHHR